jgi:hypothetical protein
MKIANLIEDDTKRKQKYYTDRHATSIYIGESRTINAMHIITHGDTQTQ